MVVCKSWEHGIVAEHAPDAYRPWISPTALEIKSVELK